MCKFIVSLGVLSMLKASTAYAGGPSYAEVLPIFQSRCISCHKYIQDKDWSKYSQAKKYASSIKAKLQAKDMPPGNSTGLTDPERQKLIDWVDGGALP